MNDCDIFPHLRIAVYVFSLGEEESCSNFTGILSVTDCANGVNKVVYKERGKRIKTKRMADRVR